jgi:hypothetical protein
MLDTLIEIVAAICVLAIFLLVGHVAARVARRRLSIFATIGGATIGSHAVPVLLPGYRHVADLRGVDIDIHLLPAMAIWLIATSITVLVASRRSISTV